MDERENKLQAGKDALLAFQKKKDKKTKKKKSKAADVTSCSIDDSVVLSKDVNNSDDVIVSDSGLANDQLSWEPFDGNINDGIFNESNDNETIPEIIMDDTTEEPRINIAASIQSSLIEMETTLHNREKELEELKLSHSQEIEKILLQEQTKRNDLLQEIKEINAHQLVYSDNDEREAKRIEQLKNTLRHLHNEEMEKIQISHQKEKILLIEENNRQLTELHKICNEKIETNKTKLEQLANEQIKQIHSQFMLSYNSLMKQKCEFEDKNKQLIDGLCDTTKQLDLVMEEKRIMEEKIQQLEKNHVMEVDAMKETSFDMEKIMKEWKEKASKLQEKINTTTITQNHSTNEEMMTRLQEQLEDKEKELLEMKKADKEEIKIIQKLENRLTEQESLYKNKISEMEIAHQMEIENKRDQQVSLLEESISETSKSQASLEFAEVHMKELQQQLNAYRNQEINHKTAMEQAQLDQQQEMKELIERNDHKIVEISDNHKKETQELKQRFEELQQNIKENEMKYQLEVTEILEHTKTENDIAAEKIINELKKEHCDKMEEISIEHQKDIEIHMEEMKKNMEIEKQQEIEEIHRKHKTTMVKVKESLSSVNEISIRDAQTRIIDLELRLRETEEDSKEMRILQEKIQKIDTELRAKEVELSICQSELNNEQMKLSNTREMMDDYMKKYNETSYDELNNSLIKERNETTTRYQDMLQQKEDEIASNQSRLKTQQLLITELTEELAQERKALQEKKAENNPGVNETELVNVQSELIEAKQRCDTLLKDWNNKELEHDKLRNELCDLQGNITNQERQHNNRITTLELQAEQLTKNLTSATDRLTDTTAQLQEILKERDALLNDKETLTTHLESIQEQLTTKENDRQQLLEDMKNTDITITDKCALIGQENDLLLTRINELELEVSDKNLYLKKCDELQAQLIAREGTFNKLQQHYNQQLSECESKCQQLEKQLTKSRRVESHIITLSNNQVDIEKTLVKARQGLIEKLRQKELLEKDLNHHRTQLERRQSEKQRLEELLLEKSRFEQELRSQKEQLSVDLDGIEKKLKAHNTDVANEKITDQSVSTST